MSSASGSAASSAIRELSKASLRDGEKRMHEILAKYQLSLPVPLVPMGDTEVDALRSFPRLKPLDFLHAMRDKGHLNKLLGGRSLQSSRDMLRQFWQNFRSAHPDFSLFMEADQADLDYGECVPIMAHIDGGRGYKKSEFMVFNWCGVLGTGTRAHQSKTMSLKRDDMQVSLLGHSFLSHYLWCAMPSSFHKNNDTLFQQALRIFASDLRECFDQGITYSGGHLRLVLLGLKGDLKLHARAGNFTAWYGTARKAPFNPSKPTKSSGRCCPWCQAGSTEAPFEELDTEQPAWLRLQQQQQQHGGQEPPWQQAGGMLGLSFGYGSNPANFYWPDLFHIYLAGVGQDFAASCLVYMLPLTFQSKASNSVDAQLEVLNTCFKEWRRMYKQSTHLTSFNRNMLTFPDYSKTFPTGTWSKAGDTPKIICFIAFVLDLWPDLCEEDKICCYIKRACNFIGGFMRGLYNADMWIEPCS